MQRFMPGYAIVAAGTRPSNTCCVNALRLLHRRVHVRSLSSAAARARARAHDPPHRGQYHRGTTASPGLFYLLVSLRTQTNATIQYLTTPMYRRHDGASRHRPHRIGRPFQQPVRAPPTTPRCRCWSMMSYRCTETEKNDTETTQ